MLTLGATILVTLMATAFVLISLFMILVILIQKPKGGGLSGAFGGAGGSSQAAFGAKTGDLLTLITTGCFVAFLLLAGGLTYAIRADVKPKDVAAASGTATPAETTSETPAESVGVTVEEAAAVITEPASESVSESIEDQAQPIEVPAEQLPEEVTAPTAEQATDEQP